MNAPFVIQAGVPVEFYEPGDFFRILASAGPVDVRFYRLGVEVGEALQVTEGYAERWRGLGFDRFVIASASTQTIQVVARLGSDVYFDAPPVGSTDIVSSVPLALDVATLLAMRQPVQPASNWNSNAALVANTPLTIFAPAANTNGAIIWTAEAGEGYSSAGLSTFIAKASAPATPVDGEVIAMSHGTANNGALQSMVKMPHPTRIAAGLGLYYIASAAGSGTNYGRHCRYTLL